MDKNEKKSQVNLTFHFLLSVSTLLKTSLSRYFLIITFSEIIMISYKLGKEREILQLQERLCVLDTVFNEQSTQKFSWKHDKQVTNRKKNNPLNFLSFPPPALT